MPRLRKDGCWMTSTRGQVDRQVRHARCSVLMLRDQHLLLVLNAMQLQRWKMDEEQQSHEMWRRPRPGRPWRLLLAQASTATAAARAEQRLASELTMAMREVRDGRYS